MLRAVVCTQAVDTREAAHAHTARVGLDASVLGGMRDKPLGDSKHPIASVAREARRKVRGVDQHGSEAQITRRVWWS